MRGFFQTTKNTECLIGTNPDKKTQNSMRDKMRNLSSDYAKLCMMICPFKILFTLFLQPS